MSNLPNIVYFLHGCTVILSAIRHAWDDWEGQAVIWKDNYRHWMPWGERFYTEDEALADADENARGALHMAFVDQSEMMNGEAEPAGTVECFPPSMFKVSG